MGVSVGELIGDGDEQQRQTVENIINNMRVAVPASIVSFDAEKQTATVQPNIKEEINGEWVQLPQLLDVPCVFPRAGGYCITLPIKPDDECLVIFSDMCIDSWWQSSGIQTQLEKRRHDLSDAIAILGITSVPKAVTDYSADTIQMRTEDGETYIEIDKDTINIKANKLVMEIREKIEVTSPDTLTETNLEFVGDRNITGATDILGEMSITGETDITGDTSIQGITVIDGPLLAGTEDGTSEAKVKGSFKLDGTLEVTDEIIVSDIALSTHKHGVPDGSGMITGEPIGGEKKEERPEDD